LILNKKSISNYETQLFQSELEKFRTHQNRLLQANHKQSALMKELTATFNALLQDKRVRSEQSKYESIQRQRTSVTNRYKRAYQEFLDLVAGLQSAKRWYTEMRETVESLDKNVETFVNNRRSEGAQLLGQIEQDRASNKNAQAELERERLRGLMERMSMEPPSSPPKVSNPTRHVPAPLFAAGAAARYPQTNFQGQYQVPQSPPPNQATYPTFSAPPASPQPANTYGQPAYNPSQYGRTPGPTSPPPNQTTFGIGVRGPASPPATQTTFGQPHQTYGNYSMQQQMQQQIPQGGAQQSIAQAFVPPGFVPPPPPPGPPPLGPQQTMHFTGSQDYQQYNSPSAGNRASQQPQNNDPWAGLNAWK
jgi:hypothetical protein